VINEERKLIHYPGLISDEANHKPEEHKRLGGVGLPNLLEEIDESALYWQVIEQKSVRRGLSITGTLLLPKILLGNYDRFYRSARNCLDMKFMGEFHSEQPIEYNWRSTIIKRKKRKKGKKKYNEYDPKNEIIRNYRNILIRGKLLPEEDEEDDDNEEYIPPLNSQEVEEEYSEDYEVKEKPFTLPRPTKSESKTSEFNKGPRYIIMPITVAYRTMERPAKEKYSHSEVMVFDRKKALLQQFDPNGDSEIGEYLEDEMLKQIKNAFQGFYKNLVYSEAINLPLTIKASKDVCPLGPQYLQSLGIEESSDLRYVRKFLHGRYPEEEHEEYLSTYKEYMEGTCSMWSFVFIYLTLYYPDADTEEIIRIMIKPSHKRLHDIISGIISSFSYFIYLLTENGMENYVDIVEHLSKDEVLASFNVEKYFDSPNY